VFLSNFRKKKGSKGFSLLLALLKDKKRKDATLMLHVNLNVTTPSPDSRNSIFRGYFDFSIFW
jgi:hypothetical protein